MWARQGGSYFAEMHGTIRHGHRATGPIGANQTFVVGGGPATVSGRIRNSSGGFLNVRSGPGLGFAARGSLRAGEIVRATHFIPLVFGNISSRSDIWIRVEAGDHLTPITGWVAGWHTQNV